MRRAFDSPVPRPTSSSVVKSRFSLLTDLVIFTKSIAAVHLAFKVAARWLPHANSARHALCWVGRNRRLRTVRSLPSTRCAQSRQIGPILSPTQQPPCDERWKRLALFSCQMGQWGKESDSPNRPDSIAFGFLASGASRLRSSFVTTCANRGCLNRDAGSRRVALPPHLSPETSLPRLAPADSDRRSAR